MERELTRRAFFYTQQPKQCAAAGQLYRVQYLVQQGLDIHAEEEALLRRAAETGHADVVAFLIDSGADPGAKFHYAIRRAAEKGHLDTVKLLHKKSDARHLDNCFYWAANKGHVAVVKYLHEAGAHHPFAYRAAVRRDRKEVIAYLGGNVRE